MKIWSIVPALESIMLTSNKLSLLSGPELSLLSLGLALNVEENWFVRIIYFVERVVGANWVIFSHSIPVFLIPVLASFTRRILFKLKFNFYSSNQIKLQIKYSTVMGVDLGMAFLQDGSSASLSCALEPNQGFP